MAWESYCSVSCSTLRSSPSLGRGGGEEGGKEGGGGGREGGKEEGGRERREMQCKEMEGNMGGGELSNE